MVKLVSVIGKLVMVLVIYENCGFNLYIEDVVCCFGKVGFLVLVLDGLMFVGGYLGNDDEGWEF